MSTTIAAARLEAAREMFADAEAAQILFGDVHGELGMFATGAFFGLRQLARRLPELTAAAADEVDLLLGMFGGSASAAPVDPPRTTRWPCDAVACLDLCAPGPTSLSPLPLLCTDRCDISPATCWDISPAKITP